MVGWKYEVCHVSGQLSRQNYHRRWRLVQQKLASWIPRKEYTLDEIEDAIGEI